MKIVKYLFYLVVLLVLSIIVYAKVYNQNANDIGLSILSKIKNAKGNMVDLTQLEQVNSSVINHTPWTDLLQKWVTADGKVNYMGFQKDETQLDQYLASLSHNPPGKNWNDASKLAYWINAYNAFTVKLILKHYPLKSIKDISDGLPMISSPWDIKFFKIGGIDFDLNTIEHDILRKQFQEPRIHFAINCASFSCPKLRNEAFEANRLDAQLTEQTKDFLQNLDKNQIAKQHTKLSKIFSWFATDFNQHSSIPKFVAQYHSDFNAQNDLDYLDYNWSLNE